LYRSRGQAAVATGKREGVMPRQQAVDGVHPADSKVKDLELGYPGPEEPRLEEGRPGRPNVKTGLQ